MTRRKKSSCTNICIPTKFKYNSIACSHKMCTNTLTPIRLFAGVGWLVHCLVWNRVYKIGILHQRHSKYFGYRGREERMFIQNMKYGFGYNNIHRRWNPVDIGVRVSDFLESESKWEVIWAKNYSMRIDIAKEIIKFMKNWYRINFLVDDECQRTFRNR